MTDIESISLLLDVLLRKHNDYEYAHSTKATVPFRTVAIPRDNLNTVEVETAEGKQFVIRVEEAPKEKSWNFTITETGIKEHLKENGYTDEQIAKLDMEVIADQVLDYIDFDIHKNYRLSANNFREDNNLEAELPELNTLEEDEA